MTELSGRLACMHGAAFVQLLNPPCGIQATVPFLPDPLSASSRACKWPMMPDPLSASSRACKCPMMGRERRVCVIDKATVL